MSVSTNNKKTLEYLFVSKVRMKALKFFFLNPTSQIHLRGAVREFEEEINAVRRELLRLEKAGILKVEAQGNRKYFKLDSENSMIPELVSMMHKSYGLGAEIINSEKKLGDIEFAILTSSYTKGAYIGDQIIDLAIIGQPNLEVLSEIIEKYENKNGREIHYTVLKSNEFHIRKRRKDEFLTNLMIQDLTMLIGKYEDFIRA